MQSTVSGDSIIREQGVDSVNPAGYTGEQAEHNYASLGYEACLQAAAPTGQNSEIRGLPAGKSFAIQAPPICEEFS